MRKFGLLSFVLAVLLVLSMVLVACNGDNVSEHDHVWDNGTVTVEPTCHSEGLRTYSCTVEGCTQTKTEPIAMTQHNWDEGLVTEPSTCQSQGTKTYACRNDGCNATKTEKLQKSGHNWDEGVLTEIPDFYTPGSKKYTCLTDGCNETKTGSVGAHSDFAEQYYFSLTDANNWSYGYAANFDKTSRSYVFEQITQIDEQSNAWKADGVEISRGYVFSENNAAVMYTFKEVIPKGIQANVVISFVGEDSATVVKAYLFVTHAGGDPTKIELNKTNAKDWTYTSEEAYDLAQGDSFSVVFSNEGQGKAGGAFTFTLTAPCNHVWGEATVLEPAKCEDPGTMQYTCLSCGDTKEETIDPIGHKWDEGTITKPASETEKGVKTFHCLNGCGETKTEDIPMLLPSTFEGANLADDFADVLSGENAAWQIGVVDFKSDAEFTFAPLTTKSTDAFTNGDPYMEIKGDWAAINGMAGIAYTFGADAKVDLSFSFTRNGNADFAIRWAIKNSSGKIVSNDGNASWGGKTSDNGGTVTINETIDFHAGETIYILINHENSDGDQCTYTYTLTKHSDGPIVPEEPFEGANLADDFADVLSGENVAWQIGVVDFKSDAEFTLAPLTTKSTDAFTNGDPYMEIKGDWAAINGMAGIAYTFGADAKVDLSFSFTRNGNADFAIRWAIKDASGKIISNDGNASWGGKTSDNGGTVTINETIDFHAGETIYILINHEDSDGDQCTYTYKLTKHSDGPIVPPTDETTVNFKDDFQATLDGEDNGWSVGNVDFDFGANTFVYSKTDKKNGGSDGFVNADDKTFFELKGDWAAIGNMAAIAYTFKEAGNVHFKFDITGIESATFSVRYAVVGGDGEVKTAPVFVDNNAHVTAEYDMTVEAGDTLYIIINHELGGEKNQCNFSFELNSKA